ncbi:hypothetical protein OEZ85_004768 [Tetradesmus obliquus]|uniref:C3H1-type domain-containing protein n=1 Tax=Tetradesmus obliquus TaxID=3088 RepID=A0ABY8UQA3_TETOB|nr:hypothetical protein OEZ85_004768 [Tetradesmus obliquus]
MALSSSVAATAAGDAAGSSSSSSDVPPSSRFPADFYLYTYKVAPCSVTGPHEWSTCPFWHPGERARRRDPTRFSYEPLLCPDDKKGVSCPRGDACPYTHHVYEYWLHPKRFRTLMCQQGMHCRRALCFFAHNMQELRRVEEPEGAEAAAAAASEAPAAATPPQPAREAVAAPAAAAAAAAAGPVSPAAPLTSPRQAAAAPQVQSNPVLTGASQSQQQQQQQQQPQQARSFDGAILASPRQQQQQWQQQQLGMDYAQAALCLVILAR